jgi:glutathione S-transferase
MKLYDWDGAPNPRRVRIFLAEKGLTVPTEDAGGTPMTLSAAYVARYPFAMVPMLELDDGTCIGEAMAICRYFEELHPTPPLMGTGARGKALVEMWERRAYDEGIIGCAEVVRNTHPGLEGRAIPGHPDPIPQIAALVERGRRRLARFFAVFDLQLAAGPFVAGEAYTVADITALCAVDFARAFAIVPPGAHPNLMRWHAEVSARPSARA